MIVDDQFGMGGGGISHRGLDLFENAIIEWWLSRRMDTSGL
jgi:hypothetical protein